MPSRNLLLATVVLISLSFQIEATLDQRLEFFEYCTFHNYPVQEHLLRTDDGYTLKFYRIQRKNTTIRPLDTVLYLQHGLADSSDTWIVNEQHLAPGLIWANRGYDVWFGNTRGNKYSNRRLNSKISKFWDFSLDQMAEYDLPAAFNYIYNQTHKKIHYIGHSQGTAIMFAALSNRKNTVQNKMATFSALGPVAYTANVESKLMRTLSRINLPNFFIKTGINEVFIMPHNLAFLLLQSCKFDRYSCKSALNMISQKNNSVNNIDRMPVILGHFPAGASSKDFEHFGQLISSGKFCKYDYGKTMNMKIYGSEAPPNYELANIQFPVHLFAGQYDKLADAKDVQRLFDELVNSRGKTLKKLKYGHATFIWGKSTENVEDVIRIIESYSEEVKFLTQQ